MQNDDGNPVAPQKTRAQEMNATADEITDPQRYVDTAVDAANTKYMLDLAATSGVFFCPGCISDWNVLARFSDVCRVFIFCRKTTKKPASNFPLEDCPTSMQALFSDSAAGAQGCLDLQVIQQAGLLPGLRSGYYRWLWRKIDAENEAFNIKRRLLVAFLNVDPVQAYAGLFNQRNIAPMYVSLLKCGWRNPMRDKLLHAGRSQPKYLVAEWPGVYAPWTWRWRTIRTLGKASVFKRRTDPPEPPIGLQGHDNLEFTITRLSPTTINGADGLLVSLENYLAYAWPQPHLKIFLDSTDEQAVAEIRAHDRRVEALPVQGRPVSEVLPALARECVGRGIHTLHAESLGLEDEAEGLLKAWPGNYKPLRLVVHGEAADWASLDGYAAQDLHHPDLPDQNP
jgi:hypothetical protein